jgi:hypothetical protein
MIRVTLLYLIFSLSLFSQGKNTFFGVDLDKDWFTLTDAGVEDYFERDITAKKEGLNVVGVVFADEIINSFDDDFKNLQYKMFLAFESGLESSYQSMSKASPMFLWGKVDINNDSQAQEVFYKTLRLFTKYFGPHDSYMSPNNLGAYVWKNTYRQVTLSYVSTEEKRIEISYTKLK